MRERLVNFVEDYSRHYGLDFVEAIKHIREDLHELHMLGRDRYLDPVKKTE